ncbi:hypothetical protein CL655_02165 [bacterium]|nr:hypothetical protein [bacterium]|tara:strand:+ start:223 stop:507 length:285 start_codon:yes stop_codon:yes gene_type:complete
MKKTPGPKPLNALFDRYKKILKAPEAAVCDAARAVIEELLGVPIRTEQITYSPQTRVLHIKHGLLKSEVLPHKTEILNHLKGRLGVRSAPQDIV